MKNKKANTFFDKRNSLAGGGFYKDYLNSPMSSTDEEMNLVKSMNEKRHRLKFVDNITSRIITHWQDVGLINDNRLKGKGWRLFSFSELVWLRVIIKLRDFGFDLKKIKKVKQFLEIYIMENNPSDYPELDYYILLAVKDSDPVKLLIFDSGEALLGNQLEIDISKKFQTIQDDYISIDLNKLVSELINDENLKIEYLDYNLTKVEKDIKQTLSLNNLDSICIKVKSGGNYILDKSYIMSSAQEMKILLNKLKYADVAISKKGRKTIYKLTKKKKINKN